MLRSAKAAVIGANNLSGFVNADPAQLKLEAMENEIKMHVQNELAAHNYGMSIEFLGIKKLGLPTDVTTAVFDRMKSERTKLISKAQNEGIRDATIITSGAERQAADVIANAQAAATRIEGEGVAEAAKTLSVFQQNPDLAIFQLKLEALKNSSNQKTTMFFDETKPPYDIFRNLPTNNPGK
jgi:membrane protease subunit HflC